MKQMVVFQMEVVPCSGKLWISSFGLICAEKCRKMDSIRIFLKTALRILLLLEIYMKQMVVFKMDVVPCSEKIWILSYGSIMDDSRSEFWVLRLILETAW